MKLVLSTDNKNKIKEIKDVLKDLDIEILGKSDIGANFEVEENGKTLYDNALLKARAIADKTDFFVLADDTGLFVNSLNGDPGVHSARYASEHNDKLNREKLLKNLSGFKDRSAYFKTELVLIDPDKNIIPIEGICEGHIIEEERGDNGFGYDSIFMPEGYDKTFAEMTLDDKNKISHRSRALQKLKIKLTKIK